MPPFYRGFVPHLRADEHVNNEKKDEKDASKGFRYSHDHFVAKSARKANESGYNRNEQKYILCFHTSEDHTCADMA
jgi:hypothetical protein